MFYPSNSRKPIICLFFRKKKADECSLYAAILGKQCNINICQCENFSFVFQLQIMSGEEKSLAEGISSLAAAGALFAGEVAGYEVILPEKHQENK